MKEKKVGPKRTRAQRIHDRALVADRYLAGETMAEIAADLGLSTRQVSYDLKKVRERWQAAAFADIAEITAKELAKIDRIERKAWEAWEKSCGERKSTTTEQVAKPLKDGVAIQEKITESKQDLIGDPRFLEVVLRCIERRCKLLGLGETDPETTRKSITFTLDFSGSAKPPAEVEDLPPLPELPKLEEGGGDE